ncbi:hypothetical protein [Litorisediminicola beolgyonensis]|uniref:Uncharacterized protein n=1 Tax=Litorisediminicola beolgyonensis TaxID=1173614 RepID=A0ABW3ZIM2_9RHOB
MISLIFHLAALVAFLFGSHPATAQVETVCGPRAPLVAALTETFGESLVASETIEGKRIELWSSSGLKRSWTLLLVLEDGSACFLAQGTLAIQLEEGVDA